VIDDADTRVTDFKQFVRQDFALEIVANNDFEIIEILGEDRVQSLTQQIMPLVRGDGNAKKGR